DEVAGIGVLADRPGLRRERHRRRIAALDRDPQLVLEAVGAPERDAGPGLFVVYVHKPAEGVALDAGGRPEECEVGSDLFGSFTIYRRGGVAVSGGGIRAVTITVAAGGDEHGEYREKSP